MSDEIENPKERTSTFKRPKNENIASSGSFLDSYEPSIIYQSKNFEFEGGKTIGQGAFSTVKLCKNSIDKKTYAVKIISKSILNESGVDFENVYSEINLQERINHPNIVRLYSHSEDDQYFYLFMEYIEGNTLYTKSKGGLSEKDACQVFNQIASAISFLHNHKLVHRDIKLENFLVQKGTNIIKLCDFGWCVELTKNQPKRTTVCGTYDYMSPEMINENPYDTSIDIWALGVLLFEIIHGHTPFGTNGEDYSTTFKNVMTKNFKIEKEISNNCRDLILKLLTFDSKERIDINAVIKHPWLKDWSAHVEENPNANDDDKYYDDVLNNIEKMNQAGKKKKKKKKGKKKVAYKKNAKGNLDLSEEEDNNEELPKENKPEEEPKKEIKDLYDISPKEEKKIDIILDSNKENWNTGNKLNESKKKEMNSNYQNELEEEEISTKNVKSKEKDNSKKNVQNILKKKQNEEDDLYTDNLLEMLDLEEQKKLRSKNKKKKFAEMEIGEDSDNDDFGKNMDIENKKLEDKLYNFSKANEEFEEKNNDLYDALQIFQNAQELTDSTKDSINGKSEKGFWDKLWDNFRCGTKDKDKDNID